MHKYYPVIKPGVLEIYCGPMKSGKTRELLNRVDKLNYLPEEVKFDMFKPVLDTRDPVVSSRFGSLSYDCKFADEKNPYEILEKMDQTSMLVAIDESQFFHGGIEEVVKELIGNNVNVVVGGLDLDFRGKPFGKMDYLLSMADEVYKLRGVCDYHGCGSPATRTQRLIGGEPAPYDSEIVLIGDEEEGYECRCFDHHIVPSSPTSEGLRQRTLIFDESKQRRLFYDDHPNLTH